MSIKTIILNYKNLINQFSYNYKIKIKVKNKIVHIMFNDKFNKPFVDFVNNKFNSKNHIFLCAKWFDKYPFPIGKNVYELLTYKFLKLEKAKLIFCHSLFDKNLVEYLYQNKKLLKKSIWLVWGGDLYDAPNDKINNYVRQNFYKYGTSIDQEIIKDKYNKNAEFVTGGYLFPISKEMLDNAVVKTNNKIVIQVNNSCDKSTLEILETLSKFSEENILIKTVLSYGELEYKEEIINKGKLLFRDKFIYQENYLNPQDYVNYLAENDIFILNQSRQQGVGNVNANLYLKNKVYIRSDVSTYDFLNKQGIKVYDTLNIKNLSFEDFSKKEYQNENKKIIENVFDLNQLAAKWDILFKLKD